MKLDISRCFKLVLLSTVLFSVNAYAGKLKSCADMADYSEKIARYMNNGGSIQGYLHVNDTRYRISDQITRYVFSLKGASTPNRIATMTYNKCINGVYGKFPRTTPEL